MINHVSNDKPLVQGEIEAQKQERLARNADRAQRREDEAQEAMPPPHNLIDAFDRVGDRQVFKTLAANVAVAMANLDQLPNSERISRLTLPQQWLKLYRLQTDSRV